MVEEKEENSGMPAEEKGQLGVFSASLSSKIFTPASGSGSLLVKLNI